MAITNTNGCVCLPITYCIHTLLILWTIDARNKTEILLQINCLTFLYNIVGCSYVDDILIPKLFEMAYNLTVIEKYDTIYRFELPIENQELLYWSHSAYNLKNVIKSHMRTGNINSPLISMFCRNLSISWMNKTSYIWSFKIDVWCNRMKGKRHEIHGRAWQTYKQSIPL